jgi:hypothetical protein
MKRMTESEKKTMVEVRQTQIRKVISEYHRWKGIVDEMESEMETPEMALLKEMMFPADEVYANALEQLEIAIETLNRMGVVEYD